MADKWEDAPSGGWEDAPKKKTTSSFDFYSNEVKKALAGMSSWVAAGGAAQQGTFGGTFPTQPELEPMTDVENIRRELGVKDIKPKNNTERYLGAAVQFMADPLAYAYPGSLIGKLFNAGFAGLGAEGGGDAGDFAERKLRNGESSGYGRAAGSLVGAVAAPLARAPTQYVVGGGADIVKQGWNKYKNVQTNPQAAADAIATGSVKRLLEHAATAGGVDKIDDILKDVQGAAQFVTKADAPLLVAASDNPVLRQEVVRLAKTNPEYRAMLQRELDNIAVAIDRKADVIFGPLSRQIPKDGQPLNVDGIQKRINAIDGRLETLSDPFTGAATKTDVGQTIENLVKAKEAAARSKFKPEYEGLKAEAREAGVSMPVEASEELVGFIKANKLQDIFGRGTKVDKLIMSSLRSVDDKGEEVFKALSFDDVDSLKREINRLQRGPMDQAQQRKLLQLEEYVDGLRTQHIPEWSQKLKDIDKKFFEEVGVPFGAQGIKDIDAARYATRVAPVIVNNPQSLRQFLSAVGPEGVQVAENAMMAKAYDVVKDGLINPGALSTFIRKNREVLDEPAMAKVKQMLQDSLTDVNRLRNERARLDLAAKEGSKRISDNALIELSGDTPNYQTLLGDVLNNPARRRQLLGDGKGLKGKINDLSPEQAEAVRGSLRAELAKQVIGHPSGAVAFLTDKANAAGVNALMGPRYQDDLKKLALLADNLRGANIEKLTVALEKTNVDAIGKVVPGLDIPFVTSTLRDRISSNVQKAVRLLTRVNTTQAQTAYDKKLMDMLTDPAGVRKMAAAATEMDFKVKNPYQLNKLIGSVFDAMPANVYIGLTNETEEIEE